MLRYLSICVSGLFALFFGIMLIESDKECLGMIVSLAGLVAMIGPMVRYEYYSYIKKQGKTRKRSQLLYQQIRKAKKGRSKEDDGAVY